MTNIDYLLLESNWRDGAMVIARSPEEARVYANGGYAAPVSAVGRAPDGSRWVACALHDDCTFRWPNSADMDEVEHECPA